jgi:hypothetical protein
LILPFCNFFNSSILQFCNSAILQFCNPCDGLHEQVKEAADAVRNRISEFIRRDRPRIGVGAFVSRSTMRCRSVRPAAALASVGVPAMKAAW